jgi:hypothetical protein
MAAAVYQIQVAVDDDPVAAARAAITEQGAGARGLLRHLGRELSSMATGLRPVIVACRVDSSAEGSTNDPLDQATVTNTITQASLVADTDTLTIGVWTFTWVASAATSTEVTIGASNAACATNLAAKINAFTYLQGLVSASANNNVVTLRWLGDPRAGALVRVSEAGDGQELAFGTIIPAFAIDTTEATVGATVRRTLGVVD